jgi:hypothetical protein
LAQDTATLVAPGPARVVTAVEPGRDLRLDLFRGLALWLIFLDHIPSNVVSWITIRNYGFSDATEIFVFISGFTAAFVYGRAMRGHGFIIAGARILRRAWQVYGAHIFLFMVYMAEIAYVAGSFDNPLYAEEMNILDFLKQPDVTLVQALLLKFKPANMDVLPLYIVLLVGFPPVLWALMRQPTLALAGSVLVYICSWQFDLNMPAYPSGQWLFNPFSWQLLFVFGAWCAVGARHRMTALLNSQILLFMAGLYLVFAFAITMTWYFPRLAHYVPRWLGEFMYPIDKTNLDVLRLAHFLALAVLTVRFIPRDWPPLQWLIVRPIIICGQHSLEIFCLGVFLAFAAHFIFIEVSDRVPMQVLVSILGITLMIAVAWLITWYKEVEAKGAGSGPKRPDADLAGGQV